MIFWQLFSAFFVANLLGYGGGPASIPLMQQEVVDHYGWMTNEQFVDMLAVANALPGPISTKIAALAGYQQAGWLGLTVATFATVAPSAIAIVILLKVLSRFKHSPVVKGMTLLVQPVIAMMMIMLTWEFSHVSFNSIGYLQSLLIGIIALLAMTKWKIHPAIVIVAAFIYGGLVLPHFSS